MCCPPWGHCCGVACPMSDGKVTRSLNYFNTNVCLRALGGSVRQGSDAWAVPALRVLSDRWRDSAFCMIEQPRVVNTNGVIKS